MLIKFSQGCHCYRLCTVNAHSLLGVDFLEESMQVLNWFVSFHADFVSHCWWLGPQCVQVITDHVSNFTLFLLLTPLARASRHHQPILATSILRLGSSEAFFDAVCNRLTSLLQFLLVCVVQLEIVRLNGSFQLILFRLVLFEFLFDVFVFFLLILLPFSEPLLVVDVSQTPPGEVTTSLKVLVFFCLWLDAP